jgi:hypothetical protein
MREKIKNRGVGAQGVLCTYFFLIFFWFGGERQGGPVKVDATRLCSLRPHTQLRPHTHLRAHTHVRPHTLGTGED